MNPSKLRILILTGFMALQTFGFAQLFPGQDSLLREIATENKSHKKIDLQSVYVQKLAGANVDAAQVYVEAMIKEYKSSKDTFCLARSISLKSYVQMFVNRYEDVLKFAHQAYDIQVKTKEDTFGLGITLVRMGLASAYFDRIEEGTARTVEALAYFKMIKNDKAIDVALNNLGVFRSQVEDYAGAIAYYQQSVKLRKKLGRDYWVAYAYFNIAESYRAMDQKDSFTKYILLAKMTFTDKAKVEIPTMVKMSLANYHQNKGDMEEAIRLVEEGRAYSTKGGNTEMVLLANKQLAGLYYENGQYRMAYETRITYDSMQYEVDSINNATAVAEVEEKYQNARNRAEIDELKVDKLEAEKDGRTLAIVLIALLALALLFGYRIWEAGKRSKIEKEKEQLALQAQLEKTKLLALRSQMNPHFIFNSINIAQSYILEANKEKAYEHLEKFAKLLRMTLDYSDNIFIPIEDEVAMVRLYLELEYNRFEPKFQYTLEVDEELTEGHYEVPGMIIQPFVENALIHGVLNLKDRVGQVTVKLKKNGENVHCTIEDNGVGRIAAQKIKDNKNKRLRSIAIYNIQERAAIISKHTNQEINIETRDRLVNEEVAGTVVSFTLPLQ